MSKSHRDKVLDATVLRKSESLAMYNNALILRNTIQAAITAAELDDDHPLHPTTKNTAQQLIAELDAALDTWELNTRNTTTVEVKKGFFTKETKISHAPILIQEQINTQLIEACQAIVNKHENGLMHAPDLWEQVKAAINSFVQSCGGSKVFSVESSSIAVNAQQLSDNTIEKNIEDIRHNKQGGR
ncbi:MAG: hypothetical protein KBB94_09510 [Legionellaceae bacterium]|nr:hypothetical protein [Legionellaceae bacterium]MBP9775936.1 hypothetical protein [Legionellaceae bacterium]